MLILKTNIIYKKRTFCIEKSIESVDNVGFNYHYLEIIYNNVDFMMQYISALYIIPIF